jgi:hypothetical protein
VDKNYIDKMITNLSGTRYAVRPMSNISNTDTTKSIYLAHFQFILKYRIIFLCSSSNSTKIFALLKKPVRLMAELTIEIHLSLCFRDKRYNFYYMKTIPH